MKNADALVAVTSLITLREQELAALNVAKEILADGYHTDQQEIEQAITQRVEQLLPGAVAEATESLRATIDEQTANITTLQETLTQKDDLINEKEGVISQLVTQKEELEVQVADIPNQVAAATAPLEALIDEKEAIITAKDVEISEKDALLSEKDAKLETASDTPAEELAGDKVDQVTS